MPTKGYPDAVQPQRSQGYTPMLVLTALTMLAGVILLCVELTEYGWEFTAKGTPAQKVTPIPPPEAAPPVGKPAAPMNPMGG
jgi:hypothetical protein